MKFKIVAVVIFLGLVLIGIVFLSQSKLSQVKDPSVQNLVISSTPTPSPTPPQFNQSSNLSQELEKVKPRDFTPDLNNLEKSLNF